MSGVAIEPVRIFTIGFTKKPAKVFFTKLRESGAKRLIDVRLNNLSQLSGFAKKGDLEFFLCELCDMEYVHLPLLAPTQELLDGYRKHANDWSTYEKQFLELMEARQIERAVPKEIVAGSCLLCSEERPQRCHRRLVAEYFQRHWGGVEIVHLV